MTLILASRSVIRKSEKPGHIQMALWSTGVEMIHEMTEDEALRVAAEIIRAIGANREAAGGQ